MLGSGDAPSSTRLLMPAATACFKLMHVLLVLPLLLVVVLLPLHRAATSGAQCGLKIGIDVLTASFVRGMGAKDVYCGHVDVASELALGV